jgi:peptidoglycan/LPS O-acetylase OafA/YrhL
MMYAHHGLGVLGLGVFAFLTGFGLARSDRAGGWTTLRDYARRRFWRVYVPYVAALAVFIAVFGVFRIHHTLALSPWRVTIPIHLACLQVLLFPRYPQCFTLWYVGLLFLMYAVYPLLRRPRTWAGVLLLALALLLAALAVRLSFRTIDIRFFLYAPVFVAGVIAARLGGVVAAPDRWPRWIVPAAAGLFVVLYVLFMRRWGGAVIHDRWGGAGTAYFAAPIAVSLGLIAAGVPMVLGAAQALQDSTRWRLAARAVGWVSAGSFFIYLFHRPVLSLWVVAADRLLHLPDPWAAALFPAVVAGLVAASAAAEKAYSALTPGSRIRRGAGYRCGSSPG